MVSEDQLAWLVGATYRAGLVTLRLIASSDLQPIEWVDKNFQSYYLTSNGQNESVKKVDLFTGNELKLQKVNLIGKPAKNVKGWELDIDPAMSYAYDKGLRFGTLHRLTGNSWIPVAALSDELTARFEAQEKLVGPRYHSHVRSLEPDKERVPNLNGAESLRAHHYLSEFFRVRQLLVGLYPLFQSFCDGVAKHLDFVLLAFRRGSVSSMRF